MSVVANEIETSEEIFKRFHLSKMVESGYSKETASKLLEIWCSVEKGTIKTLYDDDGNELNLLCSALDILGLFDNGRYNGDGLLRTVVNFFDHYLEGTTPKLIEDVDADYMVNYPIDLEEETLEISKCLTLGDLMQYCHYSPDGFKKWYIAREHNAKNPQQVSV
jgi:hypothetical protein